MALLFILLKHITICLTRFLCSRPFFIVFNQFDMVLLPRIFVHRKQENIHAILSGFNCLQLPKKQMNMFIDMKPWNLMLPPMFQTTLQIECLVLTACQQYYQNVSFLLNRVVEFLFISPSIRTLIFQRKGLLESFRD